MKKTKRSVFKSIAAAAVLASIVGAAALVVLNRIVIERSAGYILSEPEAAVLQDVDCILVLGAGVYLNKYPSNMLRDRLARGIDLYELGVADRLLMSGDNSRVNYNEVKVMKDYAVDAGVPSENVFKDHAGFSTYESMYRARDVFAVDKVVIVTQGYHLYRALYTARALGLEAYGVAAADVRYRGQSMRDLREMLARAKDVFYSVFKPLPTFLGDVIPVAGNGDETG